MDRRGFLAMLLAVPGAAVAALAATAEKTRRGGAAVALPESYYEHLRTSFQVWNDNPRMGAYVYNLKKPEAYDRDRWMTTCEVNPERHSMGEHFDQMHDVPYRRRDENSGDWLGLQRSPPKLIAAWTYDTRTGEGFGPVRL